MQKAVAQREDAPGLVGRHLDVVQLSALVARAGEVLGAVLDPLHRAAQADRRRGDHDLFGIEQHDLRAEAPADVGRDHLDAELGKAEEPRQAVLDRQRRLGGDPRPQHPCPRVVVGDDAAGLQRAAAAALDRQSLAEHVGGPRERGVRITHALRDPGGAVPGNIRVHAWTALGAGRLELDDGR